jgi:hypothetical protein
MNKRVLWGIVIFLFGVLLGIIIYSSRDFTTLQPESKQSTLDTMYKFIKDSRSNALTDNEVREMLCAMPKINIEYLFISIQYDQGGSSNMIDRSNIESFNLFSQMIKDYCIWNDETFNAFLMKIELLSSDDISLGPGSDDDTREGNDGRNGEGDLIPQCYDNSDCDNVCSGWSVGHQECVNNHCEITSTTPCATLFDHYPPDERTCARKGFCSIEPQPHCEESDLSIVKICPPGSVCEFDGETYGPGGAQCIGNGDWPNYPGGYDPFEWAWCLIRGWCTPIPPVGF